ncbi:hypothetical protein ANCCAN_01191 [Ancylostoma caninum]|uniref:Uncharacterized protein n=1 Tax=Ancylostoma caninum TaxID=29170 RepID=A0A368H8B7_ANCCA|nr:hypothetical protein ANCCAN_01191 [Ancylostoma caninum]
MNPEEEKVNLEDEIRAHQVSPATYLSKRHCRDGFHFNIANKWCYTFFPFSFWNFKHLMRREKTDGVIIHSHRSSRMGNR